MLTSQTIHQIIGTHRGRLASAYGVKRIGLFGSYAKGAATQSSDIDLIVEFDKPLGLKFVEFAEELESLLGRPVDVITPEGLKGIRIRRVAEDIAQSVVYV
ncbi:MAG TPA: nucleotidyltransferase family protein [Pyrinomonadaceae bacterium]|nr:nucleotidyltransferase family protein [Pyrinomonadaceae bacterium]